jgi:hypothetical protein
MSEQEACSKTYQRLGLLPDDVNSPVTLLCKIHWGFTANEIESMPADERQTLKKFAEFSCALS